MIRVGVHAASGRLWRVAVLAAAGAIGSAAQAEAALYYWQDSDTGYSRYSRPRPAMPPQRPKSGRHQAKKIDTPEKETAKPQGPVIIAISIDRQSLKVYDANGFFAQTPISTGMKGHPTPMGVFSVIQKQKLHHSNIYSGAPMPYMQRITWSGIAIHAGVLPGYPASHGCIRMPMAFAMKMWNWTKMGARVVVTPGEMTPASFSHPLLVAQKVVPQPAAEPQADVPAAAKSDKATEADSPIKSAVSEATLELRPTVGHAPVPPRVAADETSTSPSLRDNTHTADASAGMSSIRPSATMTDATASGPEKSQPDVKPEAATSGAATSDVAKSEPEAATAETRPAETVATDAAGTKPDEPAVAAQTGDAAVKTEVSATGSTKSEETTASTKTEAKADEPKSELKSEAKPELKSEPAKTEAPKTAEKSVDKADDAVKPTAAAAPDANKDQTRLPDPAKPAVAKGEPAATAAQKRAGQIAVFVSRKDSRLYVRQNFAPLFDVPVTIAPSDRPLGTHVFTAEIDKHDPNLVHWSVVTLPAPRHAERRDEDERSARRRKIAGVAVEAKSSPEPDSPTEALDRLTVPAEAMARITEALSTGTSIVVSDQGITAGETGEGTDFIVSLR